MTQFATRRKTCCILDIKLIFSHFLPFQWGSFDPYNPSIRFVRHRQNSTDPDQMASDQVSTVRLKNVVLKFEWNWKLLPNNPQIWNKFVQLLMVVISSSINRLILSYMCYCRSLSTSTKHKRVQLTTSQWVYMLIRVQRSIS